jgi:hypothetical protein
LAEQQEWERIAQLAEFNKAQGINTPPDYSRVQEIRRAALRREVMPMMGELYQVMAQQLQAQVLPSLLQQQINPVLQQIQPLTQLFEAQRQQRASQTAIQELASSDPVYADLPTLFQPLSQATIKFKDPDSGETVDVADTPINRIISQYPDILRTEIPADPARGISEDDAYTLTLIARYRQAHAIGRSMRQQATPRSAKALLEAGKQQARRQQTNQARQSMNSGAPTGTAGANGPRRLSVVQEMNKNGGVAEGKRLSDVI